ncbi:aldose 1-epimerase [Parasediminibacterium sp. JCM 36343]|uniref:aldose 1-epimerase n=1 Tax=Parasediminibacterium sp. JCM 36343 TaxID=3374279 RepID=UPI003979B3D9
MAFFADINTTQLFPTITLADTSADSKAEIYSFGALLNSFEIKTAETFLNIVDGFVSPQAALQEMTPAFKSAFLSPFTCRMNEGKYHFADTAYQVEKFFLPPHAIHGLVYDAIFTVEKTEATDTYAAVQLSYTYNKEDVGYPFAYTIVHNWKLEAGNKLTVATTVTHANATAIPYAQGWHPYFTLGGSIDSCKLQFSSGNRVVFDDTLLPTGHLEPEEGFAEGVSLKGIFLDNCFQLTPSDAPACILSNDKLKLSISPSSTYPYLQIYTPPHRNSIAIENLSGAPDCFNNGLGLLLLEPNIPAFFSTTYTVTPL